MTVQLVYLYKVVNWLFYRLVYRKNKNGSLAIDSGNNRTILKLSIGPSKELLKAEYLFLNEAIQALQIT